MTPASLRSLRSPASSASLTPAPLGLTPFGLAPFGLAEGSTGALTTMPPASRATSAPDMPPGSAATTPASPPPADSSHSEAASAASSLAGSWRLEVNSSEPSGRNRGLPSPSADLVSRRAGPPATSIRQMLVRYFFLSGLRVCTVAASQVPSGASRSAPVRGMATKSVRS